MTSFRFASGASALCISSCIMLLGLGCASSEVGEPAAKDMGGDTSSMPVDMSRVSPPDQGTTTRPDLGPPACEGCKTSGGACVNGTSPQACGGGGAACVVCQNGDLCDEAGCVPAPECSAETCPGCCQNNTCVPTSSDASCGTGGGECQDCAATGGTCGADRKCEQPCGPETCAGCCTMSGECISGDTEAVCGRGGQLCEICAGDFECETVGSGEGGIAAGQCVDKGCAATCEGCCDGSRCRTGDIGEECGTGGAQCQDCGESAFCNDTKMCEPQSDAKWNLVLLQGTFPEFQADGDDWDGVIGKLPDPFVRASYIDLASGDEVVKKSDAPSGTLTPVWNEVLFTGLTAEQLRSSLSFDYIDDDVTFNDTLAEDCAFTDVGILFDEQPHILICGQEIDTTTGMITYEGGSFSVKLEKFMP